MRASTLGRVIVLEAVLVALLALAAITTPGYSTPTCTNLPHGGEENYECENVLQNLCSPLAGSYCGHYQGSNGWRCITGSCSPAN